MRHPPHSHGRLQERQAQHESMRSVARRCLTPRRVGLCISSFCRGTQTTIRGALRCGQRSRCTSRSTAPAASPGMATACNTRRCTPLRCGELELAAWQWPLASCRGRGFHVAATPGASPVFFGCMRGSLPLATAATLAGVAVALLPDRLLQPPQGTMFVPKRIRCCRLSVMMGAPARWQHRSQVSNTYIADRHVSEQNCQLAVRCELRQQRQTTRKVPPGHVSVSSLLTEYVSCITCSHRSIRHAALQKA